MILRNSLKIDYNIAFEGSKISKKEKADSREILVACQRALIQVLFWFVKDNAGTSTVVYDLVPMLRERLGALKKPLELVNSNINEPRMNAEEVIIECLSGNENLVHDLNENCQRKSRLN